MKQDKKNKIIYGDFQTPTDLTIQICNFLSDSGIHPSSIIEPTCGQGNFLLSALECFHQIKIGIGADINGKYIEQLKEKTKGKYSSDCLEIMQADFFKMDWESIISQLPEPILIIGNPPWATNSSLGALSANNLPQKSNFKGYNGIDALTGQSNFDVSEWMLINLLNCLASKSAFVAMLCKINVARKVMKIAAKNRLPIVKSSIYKIDAKKHFNAAVNACLFLCQLGEEPRTYDCCVYKTISNQSYLSTFTISNGKKIANMDSFNNLRHLEGKCEYKWRSGIKHDCAKVMELHQDGEYLLNGAGEIVSIENTYIFPLLKSSDIVRHRHQEKQRYIIVPQKNVGEYTQHIREDAPQTWAYLSKNKGSFNRRKSSIYKGKPLFSIFGIGDYSFAPWKVAISGLYKQLSFKIVAPVDGKPVMLDDTCYFLPCNSEDEACLIGSLLDSDTAKEFLTSFIFWDAKRPITATILNRLSLLSLADELGKGEALRSYSASRGGVGKFKPGRGFIS